ncbi:MAG TPA: ABC transporter permease [Clostridiales bacterium]|nr:ABC transporter permease [Clostridiales bacterium]
MRRSFFPQLALRNLRKNSRVYLPYILASIGTIMMFYILCSMAFNDGLGSMYGGGQMTIILRLGIIVVGLFAVIFLLYTNSFLIKRRKKEIGLYNILGLGKRHLGKMMFFETLYVALFSIVIGLFLGMLLSKLMLALLLKMVSFPVPLGFSVSLNGILLTSILFGAIYLLALISNLVQVGRAKPVELMSGSQYGEREPKTKWLLALIGVFTLGGGYYIAQTVEALVKVIGMFFVAAILVIIGTYCLFTAGSIAVLKVMKKSKSFYYRTKNFTSVSGMLYRMKKNAVGLANICILSTMVLVMISSTVSLYIGIDDTLETVHPREVMAIRYGENSSDIEGMNRAMDTALSRAGVEERGRLSYRYFDLILTDEGVKDQRYYQAEKYYVYYFLPLSDFNVLEGESLSLREGEVIVCGGGYGAGDTFEIPDIGFSAKVRDARPSFSLHHREDDLADMSLHIVVSDFEKAFADIQAASSTLGSKPYISSIVGADIGRDKETEQLVAYELRAALDEIGLSANITLRSSERFEFVTLYGGLLFLGIFLGTLFSMATAMIIYYKQVSEGFEDKERFTIMQKVGMGLGEVKETIRRQILIVFFLPLAASVVHIAFAFKMITRMLSVMLISNMRLFALCTGATILGFALIYTVVFALTARSYYKIVKA